MLDTKTGITQIGTVIIPVAEQDKMVEFYGTLGFEKRVDVPMGEGYRWVEVALPGAETSIALSPPPPGGSAGGRETGIALNTPDVDTIHGELKDRGVDVDPEVSRMGGPVPPMFWLRDPEKNVLLIVESSSEAPPA
jgi:catechol 2,3-dioxygenase-like lactoylglutathione lyase family enzyme